MFDDDENSQFYVVHIAALCTAAQTHCANARTNIIFIIWPEEESTTFAHAYSALCT